MSPEEIAALARTLLENKHDKEMAELTAWKVSKMRERQQEVLKEALI